MNGIDFGKRLKAVWANFRKMPFTYLFWVITAGFIIDIILYKIPKTPENDLSKQTDTPAKIYADKWLGIVERLVGATAGYSGEYLIVGGWLAFKVASKWENWTNIVKLDKTDIDDFEKRKTYGGNVYTRFLIGTAINILIGATIGYGIKRLFC